MRILVIGGSGFIGRPLVARLLDARHEVAVVQRPSSLTALPEGARSIRADRNDLAGHATELRAFAPDVVIDLVLSSGRQARALVELFVGHAERVVALSSGDVYRAASVLHGFDDGPLEPMPLDEDSTLRRSTDTYPREQLERLRHVFGWLDDEYDKVAVERAVRANAALPATILRLPMVHGPGDPLHRFHPLVHRMLDGRPVIPMARRVAEWRGPRGYVENVAAAIALAATDARATGRVYNVGDAESLDELAWARLVGEAVGWRGRFAVLPDDAVPPFLRLAGRLEQHWVFDTTRIRTELGYVEPIDRREAMHRTVTWERTHPPTIDPAQFDYAAEDAALRSATRM